MREKSEAGSQEAEKQPGVTRGIQGKQAQNLRQSQEIATFTFSKAEMCSKD